MAYAIASVVVVLLYVAAALAKDRPEGESRWNPLVITAGVHGRASLSKLQIFCFSLIVVWLLSYFLVENSSLSDLSPTVLILLGVSAAGTVGGKITAVARKRISLENWSWLIKKGWIRRSIEPARKPASFRDLMTSGREFDVSKFQALAVSVVVGGAMVYMGLKAMSLKQFEIPANVLGLLGLGQVVYVGGKAVGASEQADLDDILSKLRKLEGNFMNAVTKSWKQTAPQTGDLSEAIRTAPEEYNRYRGAAEEAAVMVQSLINAPELPTNLDPAVPRFGNAP